jgi:hypothetical protein
MTSYTPVDENYLKNYKPNHSYDASKASMASYTPVDENYFKNYKPSHSYDTSKASMAESVTEKGYDKKHEYDKHDKGDDYKQSNKSAYEHGGHNYRGFKDFVDIFANKFGGEEQKKEAKFTLTKEQDNGKKRKGIRKVYHKDEYQSEDEFYDNTNNKAKAEEIGATALHNGGSHAILQSHSAAAGGSEANAYNNSNNTESNQFQNNHKGHNFKKGYDKDFNRYRDVAKSAAQSNIADYGPL